MLARKFSKTNSRIRNAQVLHTPLQRTMPRVFRKVAAAPSTMRIMSAMRPAARAFNTAATTARPAPTLQKITCSAVRMGFSTKLSNSPCRSVAARLPAVRVQRSFATRPARFSNTSATTATPFGRTSANYGLSRVGTWANRNQGARGLATKTAALPLGKGEEANYFWLFVAAGLAGAFAVTQASADDKVDYNAVRKDIAGLLENPRYDDGSYGPLLIRLAWHASGTYDKDSKTGGSNGATMRFPKESSDPANAGLKIARDLLEPIKIKYPSISYADLWTLAGVVAVEEAGGPKIEWRAGRTDATDETVVPPNGRLPDAAQGADHIRNVFYRMGFNDQEIVALAGAHSMGRCHTDRSGFQGPWTKAPTMFSNSYFIELMDNNWTERKWNGPKQYQDASGELMMLPAELPFKTDPGFRKWTELYAKDEDKFFKDFSQAYSKLLHLGVPEQKPWYRKWF